MWRVCERLGARLLRPVTCNVTKLALELMMVVALHTLVLPPTHPLPKTSSLPNPAPTNTLTFSQFPRLVNHVIPWRTVVTIFTGSGVILKFRGFVILYVLLIPVFIHDDSDDNEAHSYLADLLTAYDDRHLSDFIYSRWSEIWTSGLGILEVLKGKGSLVTSEGREVLKPSFISGPALWGGAHLLSLTASDGYRAGARAKGLEPVGYPLLLERATTF